MLKTIGSVSLITKCCHPGGVEMLPDGTVIPLGRVDIRRDTSPADSEAMRNRLLTRTQLLPQEFRWI